MALQCLDPSLTLAAALSSRSPFVAPFGMREEANEARNIFAMGGSDHIAVLRAYEQWSLLNSDRDRGAFCSQYFLSFRTMQMIADTKRCAPLHK